MMKVKDILANEWNDARIMPLFLEGIFGKAYEWSAYMFCMDVEPLQREA